MEVINIFECVKCSNCSFDKNRVFYGYNEKTCHYIAFIFENPGNHNSKTKMFHNSVFPKLNTFEEKCKYWRDDYLPYLVYYKFFFLDLLQSLEKFKLIPKTNIINNSTFLNYIQNEEGFFKNIYITDAAKCSGKLKTINFSNCTPFLQKELNQLPKLRLIFCFGVKAFNSITNIYKNNIQKMEINELDKKKLKHEWIGDLYKINIENNKSIYLIRSVHNAYRFMDTTNIMRVIDNTISEALKLISSDTKNQ